MSAPGRARLPPNWDRPLTAAGSVTQQRRDLPPIAAAATSQPSDALAALREAFTPRQPKRWRHLFVGRSAQIERAMSALEDEQAHLVLYGERGRGKTSLANVLSEIAAERGYAITRCAGSAEITFDTILRKLLDRISPNQLDHPSTSHPSPSSTLPPSPFSVTDLTDRVRHVTRGRFLLVVDEFDRITDPSIRRQLAEAIKNFSDIQARVTFMIVGVATSLDALLGAHPSIQRNILGIHVPLMTPSEVRHLISVGAGAAAVVFDPTAIAIIVDIAKGLPYFAQLFCLYAARSAFQRNSKTIETRDIRRAAETILEEAEPRLVAAYERAIDSRDSRCSAETLSALARADSDAYGVFSWSAVKSALPSLADSDLRLLLEWLGSDSGGGILQPATQPERAGTAFANPNMRQYVLLREFTRPGSAKPALRRGGEASSQDNFEQTMRDLRERLTAPGDSA